MPGTSNFENIYGQLEEKLSSVTAYVRTIHLLYGIGDVLTVLFAFFVFSFLVDFLIDDLPAPVRLVIFGIGAVGLIVMFWFAVLRPLFYRITRREVAAELEEAYPELNDRLVSALDLKRKLDEPERMSRSMVEGLLRELGSVLNRIDPRVILNVKPVVKRFGTGLLCAFLLGMFWFSFPEEAYTWMLRLTGNNQKWPRATLVELSKTNETDIVEGKDFTVRARIDADSKRVPSRSYLHIHPKNGPTKTIEMTQNTMIEDDPGFQYTIQNVREPFKYWVKAGDGQTAKASINVLRRPQIEELEINYDYPEYTGMEDTSVEDPVISREVSAPFDTIATVRAQVPNRVSQVRTYLNTGQEQKKLPTQLITESGHKMLRTEVHMKTDGKLFFELFLKSPVSAPSETACSSPYSTCSTRFNVSTKTNQPPRVRVIYPGKNKFATPRGSIPVRSDTTDDFGISSVSIQRRINDGKETSIEFDPSHNSRPYNSKKIRSEYTLSLSDLDLEAGDTVYYAIVATDLGRDRENPSRSRTYRFSIVSPSQLEVKLQKLQEEIRERIESLKKDQTGIHDQLTYQLDDTPSDRVGTRDFRRTLETVRNKQRSLNQRMIRINEELTRVHRDAKFNKLWDEKSRNLLASIQQRGNKIHEKILTKTSKALGKAIAASNRQNRTAKMNRSLKLQERVNGQLQALLDDMGSWYDYSDIIHEWKDILENLKKLRENDSVNVPG